MEGCLLEEDTLPLGFVDDAAAALDVAPAAGAAAEVVSVGAVEEDEVAVA